MIRQVAAEAGVGLLDVSTATAEWPGGPFDPQRRAADGVGFTEVGISELLDGFSAGDSCGPTTTTARRPRSGGGGRCSSAALHRRLLPRRTAPAGRTADVLVVGDSVAFNIGFGLDGFADTTPELRVQSAGQLGCPVARGGQYRFLRDLETFGPECDWAALYPEWVASTDPEVVVLTSGIWEVVDRRLPGDDRFRNIGDPVVDRYLLSEMLSAIDTLGARGATVALLTYPHFEAGRDQGYSDLPESDPAPCGPAQRDHGRGGCATPGCRTARRLPGLAGITTRRGAGSGQAQPTAFTSRTPSRCRSGSGWGPRYSTWPGPGHRRAEADRPGPALSAWVRPERRARWTPSSAVPTQAKPDRRRSRGSPPPRSPTRCRGRYPSVMFSTVSIAVSME